MSQITVTPQQDGSQLWVHTHPDTGEQRRYRYVPVATLTAGTRLESVRQFAARGSGTTRNVPGRTLTPADITDLTARIGAFARLREETP